jgi:glycosyltransferase involved in cell wall biosynthesis
LRLGLLLYGSLDILTGGFLYDRILVDYLRSQGDEVEVISLPWRSYPLSLLDNWSGPLLRRLREARLDLLLQDELAHPSLFSLNYRLRRQISYPLVGLIYHLHCRESHPPWKMSLYRWVERRYLHSLDGQVCISRAILNDVAGFQHRPRPQIVAYPGGDRLPGALTPEEIAARTKKPGPLEIIFVGNLIPRKGLHTLLAALARLPPKSWRLAVAGSLDMDPRYVRDVKRQIAALRLTDGVELKGALFEQELARQLARSQVMAVPSFFEALGIIYLEGMRFGLPALASTAGGAGEVIDHDLNGFLAPPGDAAALARYLTLLMDRERLLNMSLAARRRAETHPTWGETMARIHRFLHEFPGLKP